MSTRRAFIFSYLDRYATLVVQLAAGLCIARLLTPAEFGVFSLAAVMVGFVGPFRDVGASQYLINCKTLDTDSIRSVWALQMGLGVLIGLVLFLVRNPVAQLYNAPVMADILAVMALNSLLVPFDALTGAWLIREMRFDKLALLRLSSSSSGALTSLYLAWRGWGPMSLALGSLTGSLAAACVAIAFRPRDFPWLPGFRRLREVLGFGSALSLTACFRLLGQDSPELVVGKLLGTLQGGYLARAQGYVLLFERLVTDSVGAVAQPLFSRMHQAGGDVAAAYLRGVSLLTGIGWPLLAFMAVMAGPTIEVLYGPQWQQAVGPARLLCAASICLLTVKLCQPVLVALGQHWLYTRMQIFHTVLQVGAAFIGASISLWALSACMLGVAAVTTTVWLSLLLPRIGLRRRQVAACLRDSALLAVATVLWPLCVVWWTSQTAQKLPLLELLVAAAGAAFAFFWAGQRMRHPILQELLPHLSALARKLRLIRAPSPGGPT